MSTAPIVLVPGYWLGAWAWDEVAGLLRARGHDVTALTLPGLESPETDRSAITLEDHVEAIASAVRAADRPVVLAVHSASAAAGYVVSDRMPERIAAMVYVDTAPPAGALNPTFEGVEMPLPPAEELASEENLTGLSEEQLAEMRRRAVPVPGGVVRGAPTVSNPARLDVRSIVICTGYTSEQYKAAAAGGMAWLAGLNDLHDVTYLDLPTSHWPMWSRPEDLAAIIGDAARTPRRDGRV